MSNVLRPSGPLPPRVYWTRRLVLLGMIVLLTGLVWWRVGGAGTASERSPTRKVADTTASTTTPATTTLPTADHADRRAARQQHRQLARQTATQKPAPSATHPNKPRTKDKPSEPVKTPLASPTGDCAPAGIDMKIRVDDSPVGQPNTAKIILTSTKTPACTLAITPDRMVVRITSGDDVIWSSEQCPDALAAKEIVVRTDPPSAYDFTWGGERSTDSCQPSESLPEPGGYWVEAALIGGEPHKAYFEIRS